MLLEHKKVDKWMILADFGRLQSITEEQGSIRKES